MIMKSNNNENLVIIAIVVLFLVLFLPLEVVAADYPSNITKECR